MLGKVLADLVVARPSRRVAPIAVLPLDECVDVLEIIYLQALAKGCDEDSKRLINARTVLRGFFNA